MTDKSLKARLEQVADLAGTGFQPPDAAVFEPRRRARRRVAATIIGVVTAVVALAAATALVQHSAHHASPSGARPASLPTPHVRTPIRHVGVAELARYRWRDLPAAPIATRSEGVAAVWTGSRMLVWGGDSSDGQVHADGASYDPISRTWTTLPRSPLGPRTDPAYTWTGRDLFIWGGTRKGDTSLSDGALYDPVSRTWRQLPPLKLDDIEDPVAVWTGGRVVLLTAAAGRNVTTIYAHAYNPASNSWTTLPSLHITETNLLGISALAAGDHLYVWTPVQTITSAGLRTGNDSFVYRPATNSWARTTLLPTQAQYSVGNALWTGDHIIFQPNGVDCTCGGIPGDSTGSWADPNTGRVITIPSWQSELFSSSTFSWTGDAILAYANARAAAWDPATRRWTDLRPAPFQGGAVQIWTGTELLIWGQLSAPPSKNPDAGSAPLVKEPTGLELAP